MAFDAMKTVQEYASEAKEFIDTGQFLELFSGVIPDNPWSVQSLNECEKGFLNQYKENPEKDYSLYILFIDEGLCRTFGGRWETGAVMDSEIEEMSEVIGIYYPKISIMTVCLLVKVSIRLYAHLTATALPAQLKFPTIFVQLFFNRVTITLQQQSVSRKYRQSNKSLLSPAQHGINHNGLP